MGAWPTLELKRQIGDFTPGREHAAKGKKRARAGMPRSRWLRMLGACDQVVECRRPGARPDWMSGERFLVLPEWLAVRELRYEVGRPGF